MKMKEIILKKAEELDLKIKNIIYDWDSNWWHKSLKIEFGYNSLKLTKMSSGCGTRVFSGYYSLIPADEEKYQKFLEFSKFVLNLYSKEEGCGTFISTYGYSKERCVRYLSDLGFIDLIEYPNIQKTHSGESQRLCVLIIKNY